MFVAIWLALTGPVILQANTAFAFTTELLDRADTLRLEGKMVRALTLYKSTLTEALSGCDASRAHVGIASIQWNAGNIAEAKPHLAEARLSCRACPVHQRTDLALELAKLSFLCGETDAAVAILEKESSLGPLASKAEDVQLALIELHFAEGHWERVWDETENLSSARAMGLRMQAGVMLGKPLESLSMEAYCRSTKPSELDEVMSELTHLHTMLTSLARHEEALALSRHMTGLLDPVADGEDWTMSQLRVAISAERAEKPFEALLAFHEASRAAESIEDIALRARLAREQARFERDRGATDAALDHLALADSLTMSMLQNMHHRREARSFESHPVLSADPFEVAAAEALRPATSPGAWPFACALVLLGLLAAGLRAHELKKALRKERVRAFRMQRLIHTEQDPFETEMASPLNSNLPSEEVVEEVLTRPDRLDFDDVIASLEMDHGTTIEWEFDGNHEGQMAPHGLLSLLSVTVRRLLEGGKPSHSFAGRIRNDWHGIHVEIEGPETASTQELQRMFAGGTHSSKWNPVLVQIEKLAGRFTVEKRASGDLALTFLLPHGKA